MKRTILLCLLVCLTSIASAAPKHFSCQYLKFKKADDGFKPILDFFLTAPTPDVTGTVEILKNSGTEEILLTVPEQGAMLLKITPNDKKTAPQIHFINVDWEKDSRLTFEIPESPGASKPYLKLDCSLDIKNKIQVNP